MSERQLSDNCAETNQLRWLRTNRHARLLLMSLSPAWQPLTLLNGNCSRGWTRSLLRELTAEGLVEAEVDNYRQRKRPRLLYRLTLAGVQAKARWFGA